MTLALFVFVGAVCFCSGMVYGRRVERKKFDMNFFLVGQVASSFVHGLASGRIVVKNDPVTDPCMGPFNLQEE